MTTKYCRVCEGHLPIEQFNKDVSKKDGLCYCCKECQCLINLYYRVKRKRKLRIEHDKAYEAFLRR